MGSWKLNTFGSVAPFFGVLLAAAPAQALVCGQCRQTDCGFSFPSLPHCGVVASNHELILRPSCLSHIPDEAFPSVFLATGERLEGHWEQLPGDDRYQDQRYRFSAELPENSEIVIAGPVQSQCGAVYPDNCLGAMELACTTTDAELGDCCSVYEDAGLSFELGSTEDSRTRVEGSSDVQLPLADAAGGAQAPSDAYIWRRFFTTTVDTTPPLELVPLLQCGRATDLTTGERVHVGRVGVQGSLEGVGELTVHFARDGMNSGSVTSLRRPCYNSAAEFDMSSSYFREGLNTVRLTARDWAGNTTESVEVSLLVPDDCAETTDEPLERPRYECEEPEFSSDAECEAREEGLSEITDLCAAWRDSGGKFLTPSDDDDDFPISLDPGEEDEALDAGNGGTSSDSSGCACSLKERSSSEGLGLLGLFVAGLLVRRRRVV